MANFATLRLCTFSTYSIHILSWSVAFSAQKSHIFPLLFTHLLSLSKYCVHLSDKDSMSKTHGPLFPYCFQPKWLGRSIQPSALTTGRICWPSRPQGGCVRHPAPGGFVGHPADWCSLKWCGPGPACQQYRNDIYKGWYKGYKGWYQV